MIRRKFLYSVIYLAAIWHGYAIVGRPLISAGLALPFSGAVSAYSRNLMMFPRWSFFSSQPETNVIIEYRVQGEEEWRLFYGRGNGYLDLSRYLRCGACGNAAYQFYLKDYAGDYPWLARKFICSLNPSASAITLKGKKARYDSSEFVDFKTLEVECIP